MPTSDNLQKKSKGAAKWSLATELIVKIISPITQMILARLLAPEAFGMVATVTMVVNFADMFSDAGFQKYLVQHRFADVDDLHRHANVAFWTNLGVSVVLWILVAVFNDPIASFVGSPSLGFPLAIACLSLPMTAFSSIQMAIFHRRLNFKSLLPVRLSSTVFELHCHSCYGLSWLWLLVFDCGHTCRQCHQRSGSDPSFGVEAEVLLLLQAA